MRVISSWSYIVSNWSFLKFLLQLISMLKFTRKILEKMNCTFVCVGKKIFHKCSLIDLRNDAFLLDRKFALYKKFNHVRHFFQPSSVHSMLFRDSKRRTLALDLISNGCFYRSWNYCSSFLSHIIIFIAIRILLYKKS